MQELRASNFSTKIPLFGGRNLSALFPFQQDFTPEALPWAFCSSLEYVYTSMRACLSRRRGENSVESLGRVPIAEKESSESESRCGNSQGMWR